MISYHPDSRFLTDFAAANLPLSEAVCVSAHLEFCGKCRAHVQQLADIGGHMLSRLQPQEVEKTSFERLMSRIGSGDGAQQAVADAILPTPSVAASEPVVAVEESSRASAAGVFLPRALRRLSAGGLHNLSWVQLGNALRVAPVRISGDVRETAIYDIKAGGRMPEHEHRGEEITVLLKGSFSDAEGSYNRGDFVVRNAGEAHQPMATQDTDCICLVSLEKPVRPRAWFYRLLEPYVQYRLQKTLEQNTAF
ncbi:MAG: ChrR family anti-sigma-E factor [Gammaproteobacteria bacterium]|nr:ChrR family anti-sigma-E factor [Gammaproteobacteria bacterium]MDP2141051.1 ChrR family anti-sigma-E factor [Gammaproteobacteria bacterium]MDP2348509.1 ChrR family anti-sigma-E factor [Gammaproteobacteria bacterium]